MHIYSVKTERISQITVNFKKRKRVFERFPQVFPDFKNYSPSCKIYFGFLICLWGVTAGVCFLCGCFLMIQLAGCKFKMHAYPSFQETGSLRIPGAGIRQKNVLEELSLLLYFTDLLSSIQNMVIQALSASNYFAFNRFEIS